MSYPDRAQHKFLLVAILLIAFTLRVVELERVPPGLSHDEAANGIAAMQVLEGQRPIFFEINKGIEPLIIYLEALAFKSFGPGPLPLRLVNVACGLLTVALVYPLAARLFGRRVGLAAMAGLAISFWAVFVSRLTLRAVTLPPLLLLTLYWLWRAQTASSTGRILKLFFLSGLAAGATMYTYLSSRFLPLLIAAMFGYQLVRRRTRTAHWLGLLVLVLTWAVLFFPLANYYLAHADSFARRADQVSTLPYLLHGNAGPLVKNSLLTLGMFTFYGDDTDRYNLSGRPVFDWLNGLFFYLGLGLAVLRLRRPPAVAGPAALLLLWTFFMLLPDLITDDSPHFLRTIGALPAVYILWALGLVVAWDWTEQKLRRWQGGRISSSRFTFYATRFTLLLLLLLTALYTVYDYFGRWANAPEARTIYGADMAEIARYVKDHSDGDLIAISAEYYRDWDPARLNLHFRGRPPFVIWFDGRQALAFPPPGSGLSPRYLFPASAPPAEPWLSFLEPVPAESGREYTLYRLAGPGFAQQNAGTAGPMDNPLEITVNDDLALLSYRVLGSLVSGGKIQVVVAWQALRALPPGTDYTFLVRLRDREGHLWAETDGSGYDPVYWQPGVQGLQLLTLRLPGDLPLRAYYLTLEVVDRQAGRSLPAATGETVFNLVSLPAQLAASPRMIDAARLPNPIETPEPLTGGPPVALRGYRIHNPSIQPGSSLALTLHWQVLQPPARNDRLLFFLTAGESETLTSPTYSWPPVEPIGGEWPTSQWPAGYWVQDQLDLPIGPDAPAGPSRLWLTWLAEGVASSPAVFRPGSAVSLGVVNIGQ